MPENKAHIRVKIGALFLVRGENGSAVPIGARIEISPSKCRCSAGTDRGLPLGRPLSRNKVSLRVGPR
jgi:hypothetical protein